MKRSTGWQGLACRVHSFFSVGTIFQRLYQPGQSPVSLRSPKLTRCSSLPARQGAARPCSRVASSSQSVGVGKWLRGAAESCIGCPPCGGSLAQRRESGHNSIPLVPLRSRLQGSRAPSQLNTPLPRVSAIAADSRLAFGPLGDPGLVYSPGSLLRAGGP